jgi:hypothetical protein
MEAEIFKALECPNTRSSNERVLNWLATIQGLIG